ncbi:hypothetical protein RHMOL_Rhmol05G0293900 [Rhododendron molle]|uniref:Uncharacterized protein n=1 Tax=Rhododendron molle TaxID=49168 RepID=A0ACC0NWF4_RHOML|nr:hypothetical protein RHMOL_Rhmol05G0293900 [Rhododendron molle]
MLVVKHVPIINEIYFEVNQTPSTATYDHFKPDEDQTTKGKLDPVDPNIITYESFKSRDEDQTNEEPEAYRQIKKNLGPAIRQRLRELLEKALTIESAIEAAHTIDLLKLLNESSTELNTVRENMQK